MPKHRFDIEELPQPFLAGYIDPSFTGLSADQKSILTETPLAYGTDFSELGPAERKQMWPLHQAFLKAAHLPEDYDQLGLDAQADARKKVFTSYWDASKPAELISSSRNAVAASFLWNEHYEKGCRFGRGLYTMRDGQFKYELVAAALSPSMLPTEPAKTAVHVVRGGTKTTTLIRQLSKMLAITRPYTQALVVEANTDRTAEEIQKIAVDVETNERIHADFGGIGELWPRVSSVTHKWSSSRLDFKHLPACGIMGYSFTADQLGRHPIIIFLDDIENVEDLKKKAGPGRRASILDRRQIFLLIFKTFRYMLYPGGKLVWFGNARTGTCLETALADPKNPNSVDLADKRFNDWRKLRFTMIYTDEEGKRKSRMPDHTSVEAYDKAAEASGASVVGSEIDGQDVPDGDTVLTRNPFSHGYMHCIRSYPGAGEEHYFLDLATWEEMPWDDFLESLVTVAACDPANSQEADADLGAVVCVGTDYRLVRFVLDLDMDKVPADKWPEKAYALAAQWRCEKVGWETVAMQTLVLGRARELARSLEDDGFTEVPIPVPIPNGQKNKHLRVLSVLGPLHRKCMIRYPRFTPVESPDGTVHYPAPCSKLEKWNELFREIDTYTSEGPGSRFDDPADALQMAIRAGGDKPGNKGEAIDETKASIEKWRKRGIEWPAHWLPPGSVQEEPPPIAAEGNAKKRRGYYEVDPYG